MQIYKKITDIFIRIVEFVETLLIAAIVGVMLYEMILRNGFNKSFRASTELCGFLFMWMAFLGVIILYDRDRLITLDMIYVRAPEKLKLLDARQSSRHAAGRRHDHRLRGHVSHQ